MRLVLRLCHYYYGSIANLPTTGIESIFAYIIIARFESVVEVISTESSVIGALVLDAEAEGADEAKDADDHN